MQTEIGALDLAHVDYDALTRSVSKAEVRAFRAQTRTAQKANPAHATGLAAASRVVLIVALAFFGAIFVVGLSTFGLALGTGGGLDGATTFLGVIPLLIFCGVAALIGFAIFRGTGRWTKWMRLSQFAAANGMQFRSASPRPDYPGCIFNVGDSRRVYDHLTTVAGRYLDLGNYQYSTGSGKSRETHSWGFLAMSLDRNLPNIVLDSKANNGLFGSTNLPTSFSKGQVLSLEGDFDRYFTLYCPKEYERDALYIFTPDLMALLIDDAASFDVEIIDNWLFLYSSRPFAATSAANYRRLFRVVQSVGEKTVSQTDNYRDDRVGSRSTDVVAPQGRRLRHGASITTLVLFGVIAAYWAFSLFHGISN